MHPFSYAEVIDLFEVILWDLKKLIVRSSIYILVFEPIESDQAFWLKNMAVFWE